MNSPSALNLMKVIHMIKHRFILTLTILFIILEKGLAGTGDTSWVTEGKYGIFMHYQYRILLNYSIRTDPIMPSMSQMTAEGWNRFVNGFDVIGFADQMTCTTSCCLY